MSFRVIEPPSGGLVFDTISHISTVSAQALKKLGFSGAMLYAELVTPEDISNVTGAGLWLGFTQLGLKHDTEPTTELGKQMGSACSSRLRSLGVPQGVSVMVDLEGDGKPPQSWIDFGNASGLSIHLAGDKPGFYLGEGIGLTSQQLYTLFGWPYWKGMSRVADSTGNLAEPKCGYCMVQQYPDNLVFAGVQVDCSIVGKDYWDRSISVIAI